MSRRESPATRERRRVTTPLALAAGLGWAALALGGAGVAAPQFCSAALLWSVPSPEAFGAFLVAVPPSRLAAGWGLMIVAMMLPTLGDALVHLRARSLRRLRAPGAALFLAGYAAVWALGGAVLLALAVALRIAAPAPALPLVLALAVALVWQVSPAKQVALNRCHRRPSLAAFGAAACRDALGFGLRQGFWCLASCWALMAVALLVPGHHLAAMALVAACIWAERLEPARPPRWRIGLPVRSLRMLARIAPRPR